MRMLQGAAAASGVQIRGLVAQPVVSRDYHYEMPFLIQVDGPYYDIVDFFSRLSRLSRIINVGDLKFTALGREQAALSGAPQHDGLWQLCRDDFFHFGRRGGIGSAASGSALVERPQ